MVVEDIVLQAWKHVVSVYEQLKENIDEYETFMERHTEYTQYRIKQFVEDYEDFIKHGENPTWIDFKMQVRDIIFHHLSK